MNPLFAVIISIGEPGSFVQLEILPRPRNLEEARSRAMNLGVIRAGYFWEVYEVTERGLQVKRLSGHVGPKQEAQQ